MRDRVERLLEVHKAHIEWLLMLVCLVHQYSSIRDLVSSPPIPCRNPACLSAISVSALTRILSEEGSCLHGKPEKFSVLFTLFKITFLGKWGECGERPFL